MVSGAAGSIGRGVLFCSLCRFTGIIWASWYHKKSTASAKVPRGLIAMVFTDIQDSTELWETDATHMRLMLMETDKFMRCARGSAPVRASAAAVQRARGCFPDPGPPCTGGLALGSSGLPSSDTTSRSQCVRLTVTGGVQPWSHVFGDPKPHGAVLQCPASVVKMAMGECMISHKAPAPLPQKKTHTLAQTGFQHRVVLK